MWHRGFLLIGKSVKESSMNREGCSGALPCDEPGRSAPYADELGRAGLGDKARRHR
jgi:hypothetical protein